MTARQQYAKAIQSARDWLRASLDREDEGLRVATLRMINDVTGKELATFTRYGITWLQMVLDQHRCGKSCEGGCAVRHMVFIIAGCPVEVDGKITTTPNSDYVIDRSKS